MKESDLLKNSDLDLNEVFSEEFLKKEFYEKRKLLKDFHLNEENGVFNFEVGDSVLCFEDHQIDDEFRGSRWFMSANDTSMKLKSITSDKFYKVLDMKRNQLEELVIKIEGDTGRKTWVQANRFLIGESVKARLRKEKLKRIDDLFK